MEEKFIISGENIVKICTGEVISEDELNKVLHLSSVLEEGGVLHTKKQIKGFANFNKRINSRIAIKKEYGDFVFSVIQNDMLKLMMLDIPKNYISKIFYLSSFIDDDGYLKVDGEKLNRSQVIKLLNTDSNVASRFLNKCVDMKIFQFDKKKNIKINNEYFIKGSLKGKSKGDRFIKVFNNSVRELYMYLKDVNISKKRKYSAFYNAMVMIPFITQNTTLLMNNDKPMKIKEILDILNIEAKHYRRFTDSLSDIKLSNGDPFVKLIINSTKYEDVINGNIAVNPRFMYNGDAKVMADVHKTYIELEVESNDKAK